MSVCITMATLTQEWKVAEVGPGAKMFVVDLFWFLASEFMVEKFKKNSNCNSKLKFEK